MHDISQNTIELFTIVAPLYDEDVGMISVKCPVRNCPNRRLRFATPFSLFALRKSIEHHVHVHHDGHIQL